MIARNYYGENYDKAMASMIKGKKDARAKLLRMYPNAATYRFEFVPMIDGVGI